MPVVALSGGVAHPDRPRDDLVGPEELCQGALVKRPDGETQRWVAVDCLDDLSAGQFVALAEGIAQPNDQFVAVRFGVVLVMC